MFRNLYSFLGYASNQLAVSNYQLSVRSNLIVSKLFIVYCLLLTFNCTAQRPVGRFLTDSVQIGKPIEYALSFRHLPNQEVFFPDTTYNYYPFELKRRDFFPTNTENGISVDSVIYTLETFDINKIQGLALPIYLLTKKDCTSVFSLRDSVFLKEYIGTDLNQSLKTNTKAAPIQLQVDYPRVVIFLLGLLFVSGLIYTFFGKAISKQYNLFLFTRRHKDFVSNYKKMVRGTLNDTNISRALVLWKNHLEWLEKRPYSSYTTKEIIEKIPSERLSEALKDVDSAIYGGILSTQMPFAMNVLLDTAVEIYKNRRVELATQ